MSEPTIFDRMRNLQTKILEMQDRANKQNLVIERLRPFTPEEIQFFWEIIEALRDNDSRLDALDSLLAGIDHPEGKEKRNFLWKLCRKLELMCRNDTRKGKS